MSRAFVREDVDPPERRGRKRSSSGLPPGAINYMTRRGAQRLQAEIAGLRGKAEAAERISEIESILASVQIVDPPEAPSKNVSFGATVTLQETDGAVVTYTIVGVDEVGFERDGVSWISPLGRVLLAAKLGDRVPMEGGRSGRITKIENRPA